MFRLNWICSTVLEQFNELIYYSNPKSNKKFLLNKPRSQRDTLKGSAVSLSRERHATRMRCQSSYDDLGIRPVPHLTRPTNCFTAFPKGTNYVSRIRHGGHRGKRREYFLQINSILSKALITWFAVTAGGFGIRLQFFEYLQTQISIVRFLLLNRVQLLL